MGTHLKNANSAEDALVDSHEVEHSHRALDVSLRQRKEGVVVLLLVCGAVFTSTGAVSGPLRWVLRVFTSEVPLWTPTLHNAVFCVHQMGH